MNLIGFQFYKLIWGTQFLDRQLLLFYAEPFHCLFCHYMDVNSTHAVKCNIKTHSYNGLASIYLRDTGLRRDFLLGVHLELRLYASSQYYCFWPTSKIITVYYISALASHSFSLSALSERRLKCGTRVRECWVDNRRGKEMLQDLGKIQLRL